MENGKKVVIKMKKSPQKKENEEKLQSSDQNSTKNVPTGESEPKVEDLDQEQFKELFEKSLVTFEPGDIIEGRVIEVKDDIVFLDVGFKSEGKIYTSEFLEQPEIGQAVKVMVLNVEDEYGNIILSKREADKIIAKEVIDKAYANDEPVEGYIIKEIKGGFIVDIGLEAFLPYSQLEYNKKVSDKEKASYLNKKFKFNISKLESNNIVVSRRQFLEKEKEKLKDEFLGKVSEGDIVTGTVKSILEYGVFVDLGGLDGFIHIKDLSWGHIKSCKEIVSEGQEITTKILKINEDNEKISLGLKQTTEDPWDIFVREHKVDDVVNGEVIKFTDFGAFVKVTDGVEGLLHITELSWTKKINHPKEVLKKGNFIKAKVIDIDVEERKLGLSLKQVLPNPWDNVDVNYPIGKKIKGKVKNITSYGAFVELDKDITGLLHQKDMDWLNKNVDPRKKLKKGDTIEVVVLESNKEDRNISLGLKQLIENPWVKFAADNPVGTIIKGKINKIIDFGMFIDLGNNMEGFVHISSVSNKRIENLAASFTVGNEVDAVITNIDTQKNKISLSIKDYEKRVEQLNIEKYTSKNAQEGQSVTLGDLFDLKDMK